jgi:two-component system CheB/CheR fusion protein
MQESERLAQEKAGRKSVEDALQAAHRKLDTQHEALQDSEARFRLLVEGTKDYAIFLLDLEGHIVSWNQGAERIKQFKAEEIIGEHFSRFYPPEDIAAGKPARELKIAAAQGKYEEEGWRLRKDGSRFWASVLITALRDEDGNLRGFSKVTRDITERKQAEENARRLLQEEAARRAAEQNAALIREQREQLRITVQSIGDAVIATDATGLITLLNPVAESLTGWKSEEAIGQPLPAVFRIVNEESRRTVENPAERALREGAIVGLANHTVLIGRQGTETCIDDSAAPIKDEQGNVRGVVLVFRDCTAERGRERRRTARLAITQTLAEAHSLTQAAPEILQAFGKNLGWKLGALWTVEHTEVLRLHSYWQSPSVQGNAFESASRAQTLTPGVGLPGRVWSSGLPVWVSDIYQDSNFPRAAAAAKLGLRAAFAFPVLAAEEIYDVPAKAVRTTLPRSQEVLAVLECFSDQTLEPDADLLEMVGTIGSQIGQFIQRRRRDEALQLADRRKDEFLATLAHELRNPLAPIRNSVQIMSLRGLHDPQLQWARDVIERQVKQMARLVDDLLDISRISRGKIELRKHVVALADIVNRAMETTAPLFQERGHKLHVTLPSQPVQLNADPARLEQVLGNLLDNSAKYTEPGGEICLTAEVDGDMVVVRVRDTGMGIAPELLPKVFDMFVQSPQGKARSAGGLGIGLSLVRSLVEMHGGMVTAHSAGPRQGSEFVVRLPVYAARGSQQVQPEQEARGQGRLFDAPAGGKAFSRTAAVQSTLAARASEGSSPCPARRRLLVVDDNVDAAESLALLLHMQGHEVRVVHDGPAALAAVQAETPDAIFLDIGMPGMDGYEVARRLRQNGTSKNIYIVALTGWGQEEDHRRSRAASINSHFVKPVNPEAVELLLTQELAR